MKLVLVGAGLARVLNTKPFIFDCHAMNIAQNIERGRRFFPEKPALIFADQSLSYQELDRQTNRAANSLQQLGINKGDRVALFLPNIPEFAISYLAIQKIGAVAVSINVMLKPGEIKFILKDCQAKAIITTAELSPQVPDSEVPELQHLLIIAGKTQTGTNLGELMALATDEAQAIYMESHEPAAILYTSGTTGFPKGATLSHGNVISNMYSVNRCTKMSPEDRLLLFLPLFHCFGQNFVLNSGLNACATIVLQQRFEISAVLETIERDRITMFFGVPTVFQRLLELHPEEWTCSSLRYYFSAAAPMPPEVPQQWLSRYGAIIHEGYGLTETSPFASYNHEFKYQFGSIGMPIDNVEMKIVDLDGNETPIGKIGEIIVRGPNVMLGYWNRPQETAQVIKNGWFYTGDLGRMDKDGYFYIVDRLKDMINVSGFKVYPSEVERIIAKHPAVAEVAVYGVADQLKGEIVKAHIKLKSGVVMSQKEIINFCIQNIATYKIPRDINFVESIPKNATGKVLKRYLREQ